MQANPIQPQHFGTNIRKLFTQLDSHQNARINPFQTSHQTANTQVYHQRGLQPQATLQPGFHAGRNLSPQIGGSRITGNQQSRPVIISQPISSGTIQTGNIQTGAVHTGHIHTGAIQTGSVTTQHLTVPTAQSLANKPPTSSRIEYIPYQKTYTDYETRQVVSSMWVPVQRKCLNYYAIQNITQFLPRQIEDVRYEMVPEQTINYRIQYVPIQKKIVHLPKDEQEYQYSINHLNTTGNYNLGNNIQTHHNFNNTGAYTNYYGTNGIHSGSAVNVPGFVNLENNRVMTASRTNYVTSDGYVPNFNTVIPTLPEGYTRTQNNTNVNTSATPGFMNNPSFVQGLSSGYKQQQTRQKGPSFMNNPTFMEGLSSGFKQNSVNNMRSSGNGLVRGDSGSGLARGDSFSGRDNIKPRETRISEKDSFGSEYDTYN